MLIAFTIQPEIHLQFEWINNRVTVVVFRHAQGVGL